MNMEDKEFMEKYILNNPFEFKQGIISHCREMDKIDVYNWVAEDELKIDKLQQENQQLKEDIKDVDIWNKLYNEQFDRNRKLEDNWNKLKEYIKQEPTLYFYNDKLPFEVIMVKIITKMQEIEQGSDSDGNN